MRYARSLQVLLLAGVSMTAAAATPPVIQSYDSYQSWFVACDNGLHCVAKGFSDADAGAEIAIDRDAGPAGDVSLLIRSSRPLTLGEVAIDGKPAGLLGPAWTIETTDGTTTASSDDLPAIRQFIARLRGGSKVTIGADAQVPLAGLAAAVVRLDDRQGRIGGVTAIARRGPLAASYVKPPPPLPRIPARPIAATLSPDESEHLISAVRTRQRAMFVGEHCDTDPTGMTPHAYALDRNRAFVLVPCLQGAYQDSSLGFVVSRGSGDAERLVLPLPYEGNGLGHERGRRIVDLFTNADFDPRTGTLSTAARGRALGDCGLSATWVWDDSTFVLAELALQQSCGGIANDWPTLFHSIRK